MADNPWIRSLPEHLRDLGRQVLAYYDGDDLDDETSRPSGGNLHIALDDGNSDRGSVEFCLAQAERYGDVVGVKLARALLALDDDDRRRLCS
jgi:hypothetical protein